MYAFGSVPSCVNAKWNHVPADGIFAPVVASHFVPLSSTLIPILLSVLVFISIPFVEPEFWNDHNIFSWLVSTLAQNDIVPC